VELNGQKMFWDALNLDPRVRDYLAATLRLAT
jgi:hypothetical protein